MSMKFTRKGFFQSIFGGLFAVAAVPSILKAETETQNETSSGVKLTINPNGNVGIGEVASYHGNGTIGLGTNTPKQVLHVSGIVFHVKDRRLEMSGNENGDFIIKWLDVEDDESSPRIMIEKPKPNPFRKSITNDIR